MTDSNGNSDDFNQLYNTCFEHFAFCFHFISFFLFFFLLFVLSLRLNELQRVFTYSGLDISSENLYLLMFLLTFDDVKPLKETYVNAH